MAVKDEVLGIICNVLDAKAEEIDWDKSLYDGLGVDSTEMVEVVVALNKHFGIKLETNEVTKFSTPSQIVEIVKKRVEQQ